MTFPNQEISKCYIISYYLSSLSIGNILVVLGILIPSLMLNEQWNLSLWLSPRTAYNGSKVAKLPKGTQSSWDWFYRHGHE